MQFFATCPKSLESLLAQELKNLGATKTKETRAGVAFDADLTTAYRACLWSRLANHIFLPLTHRAVNHVDNLYDIAVKFPWDDHMTVDNTFAIDVDLIGTVFKNNQFAIQKFKDGLVDYWRNRCGRRPDVETDKPDLRFHVLVRKNELTLSLNLSGESLHKRNFRLEGGAAPLKENLAAALLTRAHWPTVSADGGSLFDPMCGSGTFLIEGALIAANIAPGLLREYFGFLQWQDFKPTVWKKLVEEAKELRAQGLEKLPKIIGYDANHRSVLIAQENIKRAGLENYITVEERDLASCKSLEVTPGLVITNPPYGERLGEKEELVYTYQQLGEIFKQHFSAWKCSVFTGNADLAKSLRLGPDKIYKFFNGTLECQLLNFTIRPR